MNDFKGFPLEAEDAFDYIRVFIDAAMRLSSGNNDQINETALIIFELAHDYCQAAQNRLESKKND